MSRQPRISALWLPHAGNVVFYQNGKNIIIMDWATKSLGVVAGDPVHPQTEAIVAAYLGGRAEPGDVYDISIPSA